MPSGVTAPRRFPPPWSIDDKGDCFIVRDHGGQALAYVYFEEEPGRRSAAKLLTKDEARRIVPTSSSCRSYCANRNARATDPGRPVALVGTETPSSRPSRR